MRNETKPTKGQFSKLVEALRRPSAIFFLPAPPPTTGIPADLRTARGRTARSLVAGELLQVRRAARVQRLLKWLAESGGVPAEQIPSVAGLEPDVAASVLREWLATPLAEQWNWASPKEAFDAWRSRFEARGIAVLQLQLGKGGLRGFSLSDASSPVIAVNTADNLPARSFTLFHELAHLSLGSEAACLPGRVVPGGDPSVERRCDEIASSALLPKAGILDVVERVAHSARPPQTEFDLVRRVAERFHTSIRATAIALIHAGVLTPAAYDAVEEAAPYADVEKGFARSNGGQHAPARRLSELGVRTTKVVLEALYAERLTERDVRRHLRLDGSELSDLAAAVGVGQ